MSLGRFVWNAGTSYAFGSMKYGWKFLSEPENRARNALFLGTSLLGAGFLGDLIESAGETGSDMTEAKLSSGEAFNATMAASSVPLASPTYDSDRMREFVRRLTEEQKLPTINDHLEGTVHPETGVDFNVGVIEIPQASNDHFEEVFYYEDIDDEFPVAMAHEYYPSPEELKEIEAIEARYEEAYYQQLAEENALYVQGVFPDFESYHEFKLDERYYTASDEFQFTKANLDLYYNIQFKRISMEELGFNEEDVYQLKAGLTPEGLVWHHNEKPGLLQLVDEELHANTGHTGGRSLWGGGSVSR